MADQFWALNTGGDWETAADWSGGAVPGATDNVTINTTSVVTVTHDQNVADAINALSLGSNDTLAVSSGSLTVAGASTSAGSISLSGGTVAVNGSTTLAGFRQSGGTLSGTGTLTVTGAASLTGTNGYAFETGSGTTDLKGTTTVGGVYPFSLIGGRVLQNDGTLAFQSGTIYVGYDPTTGQTSSATIANSAGATFDVQGDNLSVAGGGAVNNAGLLKKSAGTGTSTISATLNNTGTLEADSGTLSLTGGGTFGASTLTTANGATVSFDGGTYNLAGAVTGTGGGTVAVTGGTVAVNGSTTLAGFRQSGGTLSGTGTLTVTGAASLTGTNGYAFETGSGTTDLKGTTTVGGVYPFSLIGGRVLQNDGTLAFQSGTIYVGYDPTTGQTSSATIANSAGATFDVQGDNLSVAGGGAVNNAGLLKKSAGTGTSTISATLNNTGTLEADSGTLSLTGGGTFGASTLTTANGATLSFDGGTYNLAGAVTGTGGGTVAVTGGTVAVNGSTTLAGFRQSGGTLSGTGTLTVTGAASLTGTNGYAFETGSGTTDLKGTTTVGGVYPFSLIGGRVLQNDGTLAFQSGTIYVGYDPTTGQTSSATIANSAGATFDVQGDNLSVAGGGAVNNAGLLKKSAGTGTSTISATLNNTGTLEADSGTLSLTGGGTFGASTLTTANGATLSFDGGAYNLAGAVTGTGGGTVAVTGGTVAVNGSTTLAGFRQSGGTLSGTGTLTVTGAASLTGTNGYAFETGSGTTDLKGTTTVGGVYPFSLIGGRVLQNDGTLAFQSGTIYVGYDPTTGQTSSATIANSAGATFDVQGDNLSIAGVGAINNAGLLKKSAGKGTETISMTLNNTGTLEADSGTLSLTGGGTFGASTLTTANGATVSFDGGTYNLAGAVTGTGGGTVALTGGTMVTSANPVNLASGFSQSGGTLSGSGDFTVSGAGVFTGGVDTGPGRTILTGTSSFTSGSFYLDAGRTLENKGTVTWSGGNIIMGENPNGSSVGGSTINNDAGASWIISGDNNTLANGYGVNEFNNYGTLIKNFTTGVTTLGVNFHNYGTVEVLNGNLSFNGGAVTGKIMASGGGSISIGGGADISGATISGTATIAGTVYITGNYAGGDLSGPGTVINTGVISGPAKLNVIFDNRGTVDVENGTINIGNSIVQYANGGSTLSGGTWIVGATGTLLFTAANTVNILNNAADVTLNGAGASFVLINALQTNSGAFRILGGRNFTTAGAFDNSGTLQLGGGVFTSSASKLTNEGSGKIFGYGTLGGTVANSGLIEAKGGTLVVTSALSGTGSAQIDAGSSLELAAAVSETVAFAAGGAGTLKLDAPSSFTGTIAGLANGDVIDLKALAITGGQLSGSTLTLNKAGGGTTTLALSGASGGPQVLAYSDGAGGTDVQLVSATYKLTTGIDPIAGVAGGTGIVATNGTLSTGDNIDGGSGTNTLVLSGGGAFDLRKPSSLKNVTYVRAFEGTAKAAQTLTLRSGLATTVIVGSSPAKGAGITINGVAGDASTIYLGAGTDKLTVGDVHETVVGGAGTYAISVTSTTIGARIDGGTGASTLNVTGGGTVVMGPTITNVGAVKLASPTNFTANNAPSLTITGSTGVDTIQAGSGVDTITGNGGADTLIAGSGIAIFKDKLANLAKDSIQRFGAADAINITDDKTPSTTTAIWANNILSIKTTSTGATTSIALPGALTGNFTASADGKGGTIITYAPKAAATHAMGSGIAIGHSAALLAQTMASFGGSPGIGSPTMIALPPVQTPLLAAAHF